MGFGKRAQAVRLNPSLIFTRSTKKFKIPTFEDFVNCIAEDSLLSITAGDSEEKIENFTVIPPCLAEELFEVDSLETVDVLWRFITKIRSLCETEKDNKEDNDSGFSGDPEMMGNVIPRRDDSEEESISQIDLVAEKASYHRIFIFLWAVLQDHKSVPGTPVTVCNKTFTKSWEDT